MPLSYKICGSNEAPAHFCGGCIDVEQGGVRGAAFILASYIPRTPDGLISNQVENFEWWEKGINDGSIFVIPKTRGAFDGGNPITSPGYGYIPEIVTGKIFTAVISDPDHRDNEEFYASMADAAGSYHFAWRTGNELRISDTTVNIDTADTTEEDVNSQVVWSVTVTWEQRRKTVRIFNLNKDVFECFDTTGDAFYSTPAGFTTFANSGGSQELSITSIIDNLPAGFSIQGAPPEWVSIAINGNTITATVISSNTDTSRSYYLVIVQDSSGKTLTKRITQAASSYILLIGAMQRFPSEGGLQQVSITSILNGSPVEWTFDAINSSDFVSCVSGEGTALATFKAEENTGEQRNATIFIAQSVGTKTATKTVIQEAFVLPQNMYVGGTTGNELIETEAEVKALLLETGANPVIENVVKGKQAVYQTGIGIMKSYIVIPESLDKPVSFYDIDNEQELEGNLELSPVQITVDGTLCNIYYLQYFDPATGTKNLRITV